MMRIVHIKEEELRKWAENEMRKNRKIFDELKRV